LGAHDIAITPTLSVEALQDRLTPVEPAAAAMRPAGVVGGVVSASVMLTLVESAEMLPAASRAATV